MVERRREEDSLVVLVGSKDHVLFVKEVKLSWE